MSSAAPRAHPRFPGLDPEVARDYLDAPSNMVAEVIDGVLSLLPRPRRQRARAAGKLGASLDGPFDAGPPGGWLFLPEPELHLGPKPDVLAPDIVGWRRARVPNDSLSDDAPAHIQGARRMRSMGGGATGELARKYAASASMSTTPSATSVAIRRAGYELLSASLKVTR